MPEQNDAALAPEMRLDEIFELEEGEDNVGDQLDAQDSPGVVGALTAISARVELAHVKTITMHGPNTA